MYIYIYLSTYLGNVSCLFAIYVFIQRPIVLRPQTSDLSQAWADLLRRRSVAEEAATGLSEDCSTYTARVWHRCYTVV